MSNFIRILAVVKKIKWLKNFYHRACDFLLWCEGWLAIARMVCHRRHRLSLEADIVVSLTTYSKRLSKLRWVLDSLVRQDYNENYAVHVWLHTGNLPDKKLPLYFSRYEKIGIQFRLIENSDEDLKSYKKLVYEYRENSTQKIITADDDIVYPYFWLRRLVEQSVRHPNCIVAYRAHFLELVDEKQFSLYSDMMKSKRKSFERIIPRYDLLPTGASGVLYPPNSLSKILKNSKIFMMLAPTADDVWFRACSLLNSIKCVQVEPKNKLFPFVPSTQGCSLNAINVGQAENDRQIKAVFDAYPTLYSLVAQKDGLKG